MNEGGPSGRGAFAGAILLLATGAATGTFDKLLAVVAVTFGTINVVGGFLVTDRMLAMFKGRRPNPPGTDAP